MRLIAEIRPVSAPRRWRPSWVSCPLPAAECSLPDRRLTPPVRAAGLTAAGPGPRRPRSRPSRARPCCGSRRTTRSRWRWRTTSGVSAEQLNPQIQTYGVAQARAAYAPNLFSTTTSRSSTSPPSNFLNGAGATLTNDSLRTNAGLQQLVPWAGGRYSLAWDASS